MTLAEELEKTCDALQATWPPRSLSGAGTRASHDILEAASGQKFTRIEIPTSTACFDWRAPEEWVLREACLYAPDGKKIIDARSNHLAIVGYSMGYRGTVSRAELERHLHSRREMPDATPFIFNYYGERDWGFCISQRERDALVDGDYRVEIDAEFVNGSLPICELVLPGSSAKECLIWAYSCHPVTMCHHDLSANLCWAYLARRVAAWKDRRYTYRFVIGAETIGSLSYLAGPLGPPLPADSVWAYAYSSRAEMLKQTLDAGFVMTCLGRGAWNYKRTKRGDTLADRAAEYVLNRMTPKERWWDVFKNGKLIRTERGEVYDYYAHEGSDELVFNRFDLPVGSLMRDRYNHFPEYHTDQDNKASISFQTIADSIDVYERVLRVIEANRVYRCAIPGVPQLGRRGLYSEADVVPQTCLYQLSDGSADLLDIARRTGLDIHVLAGAAGRAEAAGVLTEV